jgi:alginate O-acetyltransferase complex protein AlgI
VAFVEARFFFFFAIVFVVYWLIPANRWRKLWLLSTSYVFYGSWDWRFLLLLIASTGVDYFIAKYLDTTVDEKKRKIAFWCSIGFNLSVLGFFKYFNFFVGSFSDLVGQFGFEPDRLTLNVILPLGISFYTFQTMGYVIDVYRRDLKATQNPLDFALFIAFFPQLVAGPIVRAGTLLPQFDGLRQFPYDARNAVLLCAVGFFKKAVVADNIAVVIDPVWANPLQYDWPSMVIAQYLFMVQIYCDFSGYSDIAVGTAALLGFYLPRNFGPTLLQRNLIEGWRYWHMTLAGWFRDYVMFPLLRNRRDPVAISFALVLTLSLIGLWHGANWTFVLWGFMQGLALAFLTFMRRSGRGKQKWKMPYPLAMAITLTFSAITLSFFRSNSLATALNVWTIDFLGSPGTATITFYPYLAFAVLGLIHWLWHSYNLEGWVSKVPATWFAVGTGVAFALFFSMTPREILPFIYFQF